MEAIRNARQYINETISGDLRLALILFIGVAFSAAVLSFGLFRLYQGQIAHAVIDITMVVVFAFVTFVAFWTGNSRDTGAILVSFGCFGATITGIFLGWEGFVWMYPAIMVSMFMAKPQFGFIMSMMMIIISFIFSTHFESSIQMVSSFATYLMIAFLSAVISWRYNVQYNQIAIRVEHDSLTGTRNRYALEPLLEESIDFVAKGEKPTAIIMFDIDHFKAINDTYGHQKGDHILKQTAETVINTCRTSDKTCRYGGEEFITILPDCKLSNATRVAEKIRRNIKRQVSSMEGNNECKVSVSLGVTQIKPDDKIRTLIDRCDNLMYKAKESGRDMVVTDATKDSLDIDFYDEDEKIIYLS